MRVCAWKESGDAECKYANEGESEDHRLAKREIRDALQRVPGVTDVRLERYLREVRPDVSFVLNGELVAIEIQLSQLSLAAGQVWRISVGAELVDRQALPR